MPNLPYISPELLREYQRQISSRGSPATAKRKMSALKKFFGWASEEGHIQENPILKLAPAPVPQEIVTSAPRAKFRPSTILKLGIPIMLVILLFLLARKVKFPIPFLPAPAAEPGIGYITSPSPIPQASPTTPILLSPWTIYAKMNLKDASGNPITSSP